MVACDKRNVETNILVHENEMSLPFNNDIALFL